MAAIQARATVDRRVGGRFTAHDGWIRGKNLVLVHGRLIAQPWRGADWPKRDLDSILILTFEKAPGGGRITVVHANVPDASYRRLSRVGTRTTGTAGRGT